jgi:hypothetical protein
MSAALAIVAVPNATPVRAEPEGVVLTPLRLPNSSGVWPEGEWERVGRDQSREAAVSGSFAFSSSSDSSYFHSYLPAIPHFGANYKGFIAHYLSWRVLSASKGQFVDYYA